jgi:glycogen synthase
MKALFLTNEYPPFNYGGAGVHVEYLSRELSRLMPVEVRCFGDQEVEKAHLTVRGFGLDKSGFHCPKHLESIFGAARRCVDFAAYGTDATIVHCHTWYTHLGGVFLKLNYGLPLVVTVHSLEPLRPWKREQLGSGYDFTTWLEKTALEMADAIICVSSDTRADVVRHFHVRADKLKIIHNGIDPEEFVRASSTHILKKYGIDPDRPYLLFVGRITRQKGIVHLVRAIRHLDPGFQVVLCAGAPDTPAIAAEMKDLVSEVAAKRPGLVWIESILDRQDVIELYSHAAVFCCPSIYEPFGIINLEAMACETAVVASAVGGIPEVVVDGVTGVLVPLEQQKEAPFEPVDPNRYARDLAAAINRLMADPDLRARMAAAGRHRAVESFSWAAIANQTLALYEELIRPGAVI